MKGRPTEPIPKHRVLREIYRHYLEYRDIVTSPQRHDAHESSMDGIIEHGYFIYNPDKLDNDGKPGVKGRVVITLSFWDLHHGLNDLSKRKKEAFFYNVILDKKQKEVAEIMGITTVSVGQYVEQAVQQLAERYFASDGCFLERIDPLTDTVVRETL